MRTIKNLCEINIKFIDSDINKQITKNYLMQQKKYERRIQKYKDRLNLGKYFTVLRSHQRLKELIQEDWDNRKFVRKLKNELKVKDKEKTINKI